MQNEYEYQCILQYGYLITHHSDVYEQSDLRNGITHTVALK